MEALLNELGDLDTEIFIKKLRRQPFDYTKWQQNLWDNENLEQINEKAIKYQKKAKTIIILGAITNLFAHTGRCFH